MITGHTARKFVTSEGRAFWKARYEYLNGVVERILTPKNKTFSIEVRTVSGSLEAEVRQSGGTVIFSEVITGDRSIILPSESKLRIKLTAENHCGSFEIR